MKLRIVAVSKKTVLDRAAAALGHAFESSGIEAFAPGVTAAPVELSLAADDTSENHARVLQLGRELEEIVARCELFGADIRLELVPGPTSATAAGPVAEAKPAGEPARLRDLDGAGARAAFPRLLAHPAFATRLSSSDRREVVQTVRVRLDVGEKTVALISGIENRFGFLHPRRGAAIAVAEATRALACSGAAPFTMAVDLVFSNTATLDQFAAVKECVAGLAEACLAFRVPVVRVGVTLGAGATHASGEPGLRIAVAGVLEKDVPVTATQVRHAGEKLMLLGGMPTELGGSRYNAVIHGVNTGDAPAIDCAMEKKMQDALLALGAAGVLSSARAVSAGGLMVAVWAMLAAGEPPLGVRLDLTSLAGGRADALLFGESQSRVVVAVSADRVGTVLSEAHMRGVSAALIGEVTSDPGFGLKTRSLATEWSLAELGLG